MRAAAQLWVIGALLPLYFIIWLIWVGRSETDFTTFWVAGRMALDGNAAGAYDAAASSVVVKALLGINEINFPYPPQALFIFAPFALLPHLPALLVWNLLSAAIFVIAARPFLPTGFPWAAALFTPAALLCFFFGQTGLLYGALWLFAFRGWWPAVALLAFKPQLGIVSVFTLRTWRRLMFTTLLLGGILLLSVAVFGLDAWQAFVNHAVDHASNFGHRKRWFFAGVSPAIAYGLIGWVPFAAAAALMLARDFNVFTAATAAPIISPYGFHYDLTVVCLGFGLIAFSSWDQLPIWRRLAVMIGFLSPIIALGGAWWVPPCLLIALWGQLGLYRSERE